MSEIKYAISQGRFHMEIKSRNMELVLEPAAIEAEAKRND